MRVSGAAHRFATSVAFVAALVVASGSTARAQTRPDSTTDTLRERVRDSLIAAILADTSDLVEAELLPLVSPLMRQSFTIRPTYRRYSLGTVKADEQASASSWVARFARATVRLDVTPVSYSGDTSLTTGRPQVAVSGVSPVSGRVDIRLRSSDTLRVFGQTMSFPGALSSVDAQALGAIGTSTVDLDAGAIGIAARIGTRYTLTQPIGDDGVSLMLRGGVEYDPKPSGSEAVSWRGTTVRAGAGISRATSNATVGGSVEVTRSFADSLGGKNLFPGGGALTIDGRLLRFVGADGTGFVTANAFYSRPLNIERPDQPTRLIPIGDFAAVTVAGAFPVRTLTLLPTVTVMRESSSATALVNGTVINGVVINRVTTQLNASGVTSSASLGLAIPLGRFVTVTPEVGGAFGTVSQTVSSSFPRRIGRPIVRSQGFSDPVRGGWFALEISVSK
jgi:hypothetical protein